MTDQTTKKTSSRWVKITLIISLAFNFLIIGAVAAKFFQPHHNMTGKGPHGTLAQPNALHQAGRYLMWKLPRERRREMLELVRMHRANMQGELNNLANARLALAKTIANQPDDTAEFDEKWAMVQEAETALFLKANLLAKDFIKSLTPQERKTYAQILQNPPQRKWFKNKQGF